MKIKIDKKLLFSSLIISILYVIIFYFVFDLNNKSMPYSIIHACMASIIIHEVVINFNDSFSNNSLCLTNFTLVVSAVYYYISSIKYSSNELYYGFVKDNDIRLLGSFLVFISIVVANHIQKRITFEKTNISSLKIDNTIGDIVILSYIIYNVYLFINDASVFVYERKYEISVSEQINKIIDEFVVYFCILILANMFDKKKISSWIKMLLFMTIFIIKSAATGSRSALIYPIFSFIFGLLYFRKISAKKIGNYILYLPYMYILFSVLIFISSGRVLNITKQYLANDVAYRFDLSDFPLTIITKDSLFKFDVSAIMDGIIMSIPGFLTVEKDTLKSTSNLILKIGLNANEDYTDTFFSMGSECFGIIGLILLFPLLIFIFTKIEQLIENTIKSDMKIAILFILFPLVIKIEKEWLHFIPDIRNYILLFITMYIVYGVFRHIRVKK